MVFDLKRGVRLFNRIVRVPYDFSDNSLRAWEIRALYRDGSIKDAIVNALEYETILKDPCVKSVVILAFGYVNF